MRHYCLSSDLVEVARETEVEDQGDNHGVGLGGEGGQISLSNQFIWSLCGVTVNKSTFIF